MTTQRPLNPAVIAFALAAMAASTASAQSASTSTSTPATTAATPPTAEAATQGILPIPVYTGDFWTRNTLTGDWNGARTELANKGVQFNLSLNNTLQSVVKGGRDTGTEVGGTASLGINLDLMKMGVLPGALIKIRGESRYGDSVNASSGSLLPVNLDALSILTSPIDDSVPFTLTDFTYYQFLSEQFGLLVGKFNTLDGDPNEFAAGRGDTQFLNGNFVFNPVIALTVPFDTFGGGVVWLPTKNIQISSLFINTADSSTTTGFNNVGDGWTSATEADFQYRLGDLPGGQNVGFTYAWNNDFRDIGRFVFVPGEGIVAPDEDHTWAAYWSGWQYLYTKTTKEGPMDMTNGHPDLQGIGLFARVGTADQDTNPVEYALSVGIGGRGLIPTRDNDTYGLGYYYIKVQSERLTNALGISDHTQGLETYYSLAITPAARLTFDAQYIESAAPNIDSSVVLGMRLSLTF